MLYNYVKFRINYEATKACKNNNHRSGYLLGAEKEATRSAALLEALEKINSITSNLDSYEISKEAIHNYKIN